MNKNLKQKLNHPLHIRVVQPSDSLGLVLPENVENAINCLKKLGFEVSFSKNTYNRDILNSSSIKDRIDDIHEAFKDKTVDVILSAMGGYNCNQLVDYLDYDLIKANPKPMYGFSDVTVLSNAIYAKTGLVGYSGVDLTSFGMLEGLEYTIENFLATFSSDDEYEVIPSKKWSDDAWFIKDGQESRKFIQNDGPWIINPLAESINGKCLGGNINALKSLACTEYLPILDGSILMLETTWHDNINCFERTLVSISQQPGFENIKAILIGRFQGYTRKTANVESLKYVISNIEKLKDVPIIANLDFGHTTPSFTFPIGGTVSVSQDNENISIKFSKS